jgi:hypothetical protein
MVGAALGDDVPGAHRGLAFVHDQHDLDVELDADITSGWNVQVAGRFEDYSDFGSTLNGKVASRLELIEGFALRGAISTGFRASSLQQQFFAAAATNNIGGLLVDAVTLPVNNPVAVALGATPLKAEKSVPWSAGAVFDKVDGLNVTFDYYQIDIDDRIVLTDNLTASRDAAGNPSGNNPGRGIAQILNDAGFTSISAARFFFNGIDLLAELDEQIATLDREIARRAKEGRRGSLAVDDDPRHRSDPSHRRHRLGTADRDVPQRPRLRCMAWPCTAPALNRRQAAARQHHQDGRADDPAAAHHRCKLGGVASQQARRSEWFMAGADAGAQAAHAGVSCARQQDGADGLGVVDQEGRLQSSGRSLGVG